MWSGGWSQECRYCRSSIERSATTSETSKLQARKSREAAFLPRCIFNLAMNEVLHWLSKYDCRWRYAMQLLAVGEKTYHARIRRTALSIYRQQSRILYNSTMEIGKVHEERKYQRQRQSTTPGGSEPTKTGSEKRQSHKRNDAAVAVWLRYILLFPVVERAKRGCIKIDAPLLQICCKT